MPSPELFYGVKMLFTYINCLCKWSDNFFLLLIHASIWTNDLFWHHIFFVCVFLCSIFSSPFFCRALYKQNGNIFFSHKRERIFFVCASLSIFIIEKSDNLLIYFSQMTAWFSKCKKAMVTLEVVEVLQVELIRGKKRQLRLWSGKSEFILDNFIKCF